MKNIARTIGPLLGSIALFLLSTGYLSADAFEQTALYETIEELREKYPEKVKATKRFFNNVTTGYVPEPPPVDKLESITPESSRRPNTAGPQDLPLVLTDFLIDRATHELLTGFLRNMLNADKPSAKFLMPAMAVILGNLDDYEVSALVPTLRSAAVEDMRNLIGNLLSYCSRRSLDKNQHVSLCDIRLQFGTRIDDLKKLHLVLELVRHGAGTSVALERLSEIVDDNTCNSKSLRTVGILAREWTYLSIEEEIGSEVKTLRSFVLDDIENSGKYMSYLQKKLTFLSLSGAQVHQLFAGVVRRLDQVNRLIKDAKDPVPVADVLGVTIETVDFVERSVCPDQSAQDDVFDLLLWGYRAAAENRYTDLVTVVLRFFDLLIRVDDCVDCAVVRLFVLAASVAEADTAETVWDILKSFADPVGSFATKRVSGLHATVGAYFGAVGGFELVEDDLGYQIGLALPVGMELSGGLGGWSLGVFLSPLDLGVIASYRLTDNANERNPEMGWEQLLSPSAYIVLGFPDLPFAVALGVQYAPELRTVEKSSAGGDLIEEAASALRISLMAAVDVTLFRF